MSEGKQPRTDRAHIESLEPRRMFASVISGMVYSDDDADGMREREESGLAHQRVYLDSNVDGKWQKKEASTFTDAKGRYSFTATVPGVYRVRLAPGGGYRQTSLGHYDIPANGNDFHAANDFGLSTTAVVRGSVFDDSNGDGVRQKSESGLAGVRIYIDKNNNGRFDTGERSRSTDSDGGWRFTGLKAGKYRIRIDLEDDGTVTSPSRGYLVIQLKQAQSLSNRSLGVA